MCMDVQDRPITDKIKDRISSIRPKLSAKVKIVYNTNIL